MAAFTLRNGGLAELNLRELFAIAFRTGHFGGRGSGAFTFCAAMGTKFGTLEHHGKAGGTRDCGQAGATMQAVGRIA